MKMIKFKFPCLLLPLLYLLNINQRYFKVFSFPDSSNPVMIYPVPNINEIIRNSQFTDMTPCSFIIASGTCSTNNPIIVQNISLASLPLNCINSIDNWSSIIFNFQASVIGPDFENIDRIGGVWLGDINILRTSTPEPSQNNSSLLWSMSKDISIFRSYIINQFKQYSSLQTLVSLPYNIQSSTYSSSSSIKVIISLSIIPSFTNTKSFPFEIFPLNHLPNNLNSSFSWDFMKQVGTTKLSYAIPIYAISKNTSELYIQLLVSPHECEEFYYSNDDSLDNGFICGGGNYREVQVHINGQLAAARYPFPVILTDGLNPLLWKPMSGIMSFDIQMMKFDITPFLHYFHINEGDENIIEILIYGQNYAGYWFIDSHLLLYNNPLASSGIISSEFQVIDSLPLVSVSKSIINETSFMIHTHGYHTITISRIMILQDGNQIAYNVAIDLFMYNDNQFADDAAIIITYQHLLSSSISSLSITIAENQQRLIKSIETIDRYPMYQYGSYIEDEKTSTVEIVGKLDYSFHKKIIFFNNQDDFNYQSIEISDQLLGEAIYNTSTIKSFDPNFMTSYSHQDFNIQISNNKCYRRVSRATNGSFQSDEILLNDVGDVSTSCQLPVDVYLCGYDVC